MAVAYIGVPVGHIFMALGDCSHVLLGLGMRLQGALQMLGRLLRFFLGSARVLTEFRESLGRLALGGARLLQMTRHGLVMLAKGARVLHGTVVMSLRVLELFLVGG